MKFWMLPARKIFECIAATLRGIAPKVKEGPACYRKRLRWRYSSDCARRRRTGRLVATCACRPFFRFRREGHKLDSYGPKA